jgi:hypothetical protein
MQRATTNSTSAATHPQIVAVQEAPLLDQPLELLLQEAGLHRARTLVVRQEAGEPLAAAVLGPRDRRCDLGVLFAAHDLAALAGCSAAAAAGRLRPARLSRRHGLARARPERDTDLLLGLSNPEVEVADGLEREPVLHVIVEELEVEAAAGLVVPPRYFCQEAAEIGGLRLERDLLPVFELDRAYGR